MPVGSSVASAAAEDTGADPEPLPASAPVPQATTPSTATTPTGPAASRVQRLVRRYVRMFDVRAPIRPRSLAAASTDGPFRPDLGFSCA
jgi:hypothetical protein